MRTMNEYMSGIDRLLIHGDICMDMQSFSARSVATNMVYGGVILRRLKDLAWLHS